MKRLAVFLLFVACFASRAVAFGFAPSTASRPPDVLGSVGALLPEGQPSSSAAHYRYDAFGGFRTTAHPGGDCSSQPNALACNAPLTYTGHLYDAESNLFYFGARYYDPETGRFLTNDPVAGDALNPPSLHKYLYAYSSPMTFVDPWGEKLGDWWDPKTYLGGRAKGTFGAAMSKNGTIVLTDPGNHRVLRIPRKVAEEHSADLYYALVGTGAMDVRGAMNFMGSNGLLPALGTEAYSRIVFGTAGSAAHAYLKLQAQINLEFAAFVATEGIGGSALERVIANPEVRGAIASGLGGSTAEATGDVANGHAPSLKRMAIAALTAGGSRYVAGATGVIKLESGTQEVEQGAETALESDSALSSRQYISNSTTAGAKEAYAAERAEAEAKLAPGRGAIVPYDAKFAARQVRSVVGEAMTPEVAAIRRLDASARVGFRGSLARGIKGPHKGSVPFDSSDFDIDAFIVSDALAARFPRRVWWRSGSSLPEVEAAQVRIQEVLRRQLPGLRDEPFTFRIFTQKEFTRKVGIDERFFVGK